MVFHCRCFSFSFQEEGYETTTQTKSTSTQTFYTASSDLNRSVPDSQAKVSIFSNLVQKSSNLRLFTFADLKEATMDFDEASVIGEGGLGLVYRGVIKNSDHPFDEIEVAVKDAIKALQASCFVSSF